MDDNFVGFHNGLHAGTGDAPNLIRGIYSLQRTMQICATLPITKIMNITTRTIRNINTGNYKTFFSLLIQNIIYTEPGYDITYEDNDSRVTWYIIITFFINYLVVKAVPLLKVLECRKFRVSFIIEFADNYITVNSDYYNVNGFNSTDFTTSIFDRIKAIMNSDDTSDKYKLLKSYMLKEGSIVTLKIKAIKIDSYNENIPEIQHTYMVNNAVSLYLQKFDSLMQIEVNNQAIENVRLTRNVVFTVNSMFKTFCNDYLLEIWNNYYNFIETNFYDLVYTENGLGYAILKQPTYTYNGKNVQLIYNLSYVHYFDVNQRRIWVSYKNGDGKSFGFIFTKDGLYFIDDVDNAKLEIIDTNNNNNNDIPSLIGRVNELKEENILIDKNFNLNDALIYHLNKYFEITIDDINRDSAPVYEVYYINNLIKYKRPIKMHMIVNGVDLKPEHGKLSDYEEGLVSHLNAGENKENNIDVVSRVLNDENIGKLEKKTDVLQSDIIWEDFAGENDNLIGIDFESNDAIVNNYSLIEDLFLNKNELDLVERETKNINNSQLVESSNIKNNIVMNFTGNKRQYFDEELNRGEKLVINGNSTFITKMGLKYEVMVYKTRYQNVYKPIVNGEPVDYKFESPETLFTFYSSIVYYNALKIYKQLQLDVYIVFYSRDNKKYVLFSDNGRNVKYVYYILSETFADENESSISDTLKKHSGDRYSSLFVSGGSYKQLPDVMSSAMRKCVLNIQNDTDNKCFVYCVNAWKMIRDGYKTKDPKRPNQYKNKFYFNFENMQTDNTKFDDIDIFVESNKINVMVWVMDDLLNCSNSYSSNKDYIDCIYLLLYKNHYMLIKNLSKFLEISRTKTSSRKKVYLCDLCNVHIEYSQDKLSQHKKYYCNKRIIEEEIADEYELPNSDHVYFKSKSKKVPVGYIICADFEAILKKYNDESNLQILRVSTHVPYAVGYTFTCDDELIYSGNFVGLDCSKQFIDFVDNISKDILVAKNRYNETISKFTNSFQKCYICSNDISFGVCDANNNYFHPKCISKYVSSRFKLVILFHNFKNYDSHFIIDSIFTKYKSIFTIPKSKEKYTAIEYFANEIKIRYIDSRSFLPDSLDSLSKKMKKFKYNPQLNNKKMAFPYEYIDCEERLFDQCLPKEHEKWESSLCGNKYTADEIDYAINDFNEKKCRNILEYSVIYMMNDVFLLLEIIYDFKTTMMETYELDPLHYYTLPSYAWDVALKSLEYSIKKIQLVKCKSLISNLMTNMRGGISTVSKRKWIKDDDNNSIFYWDANNLYGWAMSQKLPYDDIKEVTIPDDYIAFINNYNDNSERGYFMLVDIKYIENHDELPYLPEKYNNRLCATLRDKNFYFCHIKNLQQAINNGVQVVKVHKVVSFKHDYWLKPYIDFNTQLRASSDSESKKNFFKLMNNAVFGKSMENVFKQSKFKPVASDDTDTINKLHGDPKYISSENYTDNILIFEMKKIPIYDKPSYIGFCILELSKYKMYDTFYNGIKKKWPTSCLSYMDTDSFIVNIPIPRNKFTYDGVEEYFDLSVYGEGHQWYSANNKGVLGKLKDEYPKDYIKEFVAIKSKLYGLTCNSGKFVLKCKGIPRLNTVSMDSLKENLKDNLAKYGTHNQIMSKNHVIGTFSVTKKILSSEEDQKRINLVLDFGDEHERYVTVPHK